MAYRRTLRTSVGCTGIGLHSGRPARLELRPAPAGSGIRFRRSDQGAEIAATSSELHRLDHATTLGSDGASIETVEHLLSALFALGVDDCVVELDGPEVPALDGSAAPFVILIHEAGTKPQRQAREFLKILRPVEVVRGVKWARLLPSDHFRVSYTIGFDHPLLRHQHASFRISPETFASEIAPARTFGFLREVETLRRSGLALGGSLENAIVIGETGVLNNKLRFEDEFVRHKILDAIGDLSLLGHPIVGHLEANKAGHALHAALVQKLMQNTDAWALVPHPQAPVLDVPRAPRPLTLAPEPR
jgi:UDP-3-O-[3-hydroxymyristoyl] N-acetylglucosamine deacetylase